MFKKNHNSIIVRIVLTLTFLAGTIGATPASVSAEDSKIPSSVKFLDDGDTLKLDGSVPASFQPFDTAQGGFDGWDVQLDSDRGPIFSPKDLEAFSPLAATTAGNWSALGSNLAGTDGAISMPAPFNSSQVDVITVSGTDIYVGGCFENAGGTQLLITLPNGMEPVGQVSVTMAP